MCQTWSQAPTAKASMTSWSELGFETRMMMLSGTDAGGAIRWTKVFVARVRNEDNDKWKWPVRPEESPLRPMSNLLTPPGLVPRHKYLSRSVEGAVCARTDPMPGRPGALIRTEKGVRGLQLNEFCHGLGFPKSISEHLSRSMAVRTTSVFQWEFLSPALSEIPPKMATSPDTAFASVSSTVDENAELTSNAAGTAACPPFSWKPSDLKEGGKWFLTRITNLREACKSCTDPSGAFDDGISRLNRHRMNYDLVGPNPRWLQLLWWEYPPDQWEDQLLPVDGLATY